MAYIANPVTFDGTNDNLLRNAGLTGAADSKLVTFSVWARRVGGLGALQYIIQGLNAVFQLRFDVDDTFLIRGENPVGGAQILLARTSAVTDTNWHHYAGSFNMGTALKQLRLDGVLSYNETTFTDTNIDFVTTNWGIGSSSASADRFNGDMADLLIWFGVECDLSVPANMELFLKGGGPVDPAVSIAALGSPIVALYGPTVDWHTNQGPGLGFAETGALEDGAVPLPAAAPEYEQVSYQVFNDDGTGLGPPP